MTVALAQACVWQPLRKRFLLTLDDGRADDLSEEEVWALVLVMMRGLADLATARTLGAQVPHMTGGRGRLMATARKTDAANDEKAPARRPGHAVIGVDALRAAMRGMNAVIERRNTIPVLSCVLVTVGPSTMTLAATDLDLELVQQLDLAEAGKGAPFALAIEAGTLAAICAKLPKGETMTLDELPAPNGGGKLRVSCGRTRYELHALPATDFPGLSVNEWPVQFEMPRATLLQLIEAVAFAQCTEEVRYYLNGIFLHMRGEDAADHETGKLLAAATDGHRLATMAVDAPDGAEGLIDLAHGGVILARKSVKVLSGLLDNETMPHVELALSASRLRCDIGSITLTTKLIDGQFPDYRRVIPANNPVRAWVDPVALASSVDRVRTVSTEKTRAVQLDLDGGLVKASVRSPENGTAEEETEATLEGLPDGGLTIGFNSAYLIEVLRHVTASPALLQMSEPAAPVLVMDAEDAARRFVLMPMRV